MGVTTEKRPNEMECRVSKVDGGKVRSWASLENGVAVLAEFPVEWFTFPLWEESDNLGGTEFYWNSETNEIRQRTWDNDELLAEIDELMKDFTPLRFEGE